MGGELQRRLVGDHGLIRKLSIATFSIVRSAVQWLTGTRSNWRVIVVVRPAGWLPRDCFDVPPNAEELWVEDTGLTRCEAREQLSDLNSESLFHGGRTWLVAQKCRHSKVNQP